MHRSPLVSLQLFVVLLATTLLAHEVHEKGAVLSVRPDGPAAVAGLVPGDRLLAIAGRRLDSAGDLHHVLATHRPGETVPLEIERSGRPLTLSLTFGEAPDGGVSVGFSIALGAEPADEVSRGDTPAESTRGLGRAECVAHVDATYRLGPLAGELGLDLTTEIDALGKCMAQNVERMAVPMPVGWCDNVFKIHCSGLDLLTEVGEALAARCEQELADAAGSSSIPSGEAELRCVRDRVFERFSRRGGATAPAECREVLEECAAGPGDAPSEAAGSSDDGSGSLPSGNAAASGEPSPWTQWGGPDRDFRAPSDGSFPDWTEGGPRILWRRPLGDGYSAVLASEGRLYTMAATGTDEESVLALDAETGATLWETGYRPPPYEGLRGYGSGPRSTPLLAGDRLFTVGATGTLLALDVRDGRILWQRELWGDGLGGTPLGHGYASSPVARADSVIALVGGAEAGLVAFDQATGAVRWQSPGCGPGYSSPRIVELAGRPQLLAFAAEGLVALDPDDGSPLWRYPHANQWGHNISMPLVRGDTIFLSSPQTGARGLRLSADGPASLVDELWSERRVQLYHGSAVLLGGLVVGSTGVTSPAFLTAVDLETGEIAWRRRGFAKANVVAAGDRILVLDENGLLALATATSDDLVVHRQVQLLEGPAWTPPTLVGRKLWVRNRTEILAALLG
jgi:outer membrane protein assembly factor BamB